MKFRILLLIAALAAVGLTPLAAGATTTLVPRTHTLNMNIGCQQGANGTTCDTTEYWLGRDTGNNSVASALDFTPVGYAEGGNAREFAANDTVNASYLLRTDKALTGTVVLTGFLGPVVSADATVSLEVTAHVAGTPIFQSTTIASQTVNKVVDTDGTFDFSVDLDSSLENVEVDNLNVTVTSGSVNLLTSGFMDGKGGSFIRLPWYEVVTG